MPIEDRTRPLHKYQDDSDIRAKLINICLFNFISNLIGR